MSRQCRRLWRNIEKGWLNVPRNLEWSIPHTLCNDADVTHYISLLSILLLSRTQCSQEISRSHNVDLMLAYRVRRWRKITSIFIMDGHIVSVGI